jgi:hypothetical protein
MNWFPAKDPERGNSLSCDAIELVIVPRTADLGGFTVRRALPSTRRRMVGPFFSSITWVRPNFARAQARHLKIYWDASQRRAAAFGGRSAAMLDWF